MILANNHAIANEAKYTEPNYKTVKEWIGDPPKENRRMVLEGWLRLIESATGRSLPITDVLGCTYQLIHRTASVCSVVVSQRSVVYILFDPSADQIQDIRHQLKFISGLIGKPEKVDFRLLRVRLKKSDRYLSLQRAWDNGERDLSTPVRDGLLSGDLMEFDDQEVEII